MFTVTHFRSEFVHQGQAKILRKVTMTQFMLVILLTSFGIGVVGLPYWIIPLLIILGYVAGYVYQGEILLKRVVAYLIVWIRQVAGKPRIVTLE